MDKFNIVSKAAVKNICISILAMVSLFICFNVEAKITNSINNIEIKRDSAQDECVENAPLPTYPTIYTNLLVPQANSKVLIDGVAAAFDDRFSAAVDGNDAIKLWNFDENIALIRGTNALAIEFRPKPKLTDTLFYKLYLRQQPYTLQFYTQNLSILPAGKAVLIDKYLHTKTTIKLTDTVYYSFTPNQDTNSYRNRFSLIFYKKIATTPVEFEKSINENELNVSSVATGNLKSSITVMPNPGIDLKMASLKFLNVESGKYGVDVYSAAGQKVFSQQIQHVGKNEMHQLNIKANLSKGLYAIRIMNLETGKIFNINYLQISTN